MKNNNKLLERALKQGIYYTHTQTIIIIVTVKINVAITRVPGKFLFIENSREKDIEPINTLLKFKVLGTQKYICF